MSAPIRPQASDFDALADDEAFVSEDVPRAGDGGRQPARWVLLHWMLGGVLIGLSSGSASACFLWLLHQATAIRLENELLVWSLPIAGLCIGWAYDRFGKPIQAGNDLVIETIHLRGGEIPARMTPMVLAGTVLTHLFGGSAGREGTAVQMGAGLADWLAFRLRIPPSMRAQWLVAGVAGGFGSVFGTPIAGTMFALELVVIGRMNYRALCPALVAAIVGHMTTEAWGIHHDPYPVVAEAALSPLLLGKWVLFSVAVAATIVLFVELTHRLKSWGKRFLPSLPVRMMVGGVVVVVLWRLVGTGDYLGLGVPTILRAFSDPNLPVHAFALKLLFTAVTLSAGFLGGEVTPLFFIGATLGSVLGFWLGIPIDLAAGVGMAAAFACASNAPVALSVMAVELLGVAVLPHVAIVCVLAFVMTGHRGIYHAQRVHAGKFGARALRGMRLHEVRASRQ